MSLFEAATAGDTAAVRRLLADRKTKVDAPNRESVVFDMVIAARKPTPLIAAAGFGHTDVCRLLLDAGAVIDRPAEQGETALLFAAIMGHTDVVGLLLDRGANVHARNKTNDTALHYAVRQVRAQTVRVLLAAGADLEARDRWESTPLHWAVQLADHGETLAKLAKSQGQSAGAIRKARLPKDNGTSAILSALLDAGADPNAPNSNQYTPLHEAVSGRKLAVTRLLLEHGADVQRTTIHDCTPLNFAYDDPDITQLLLDAGADPDHRGRDGKTAALSAAAKGNVAVLERLAAAGADLTLAAEDGATPMSEASQRGDRPLVEALERLGIPVPPEQAQRLRDEELCQAVAAGRLRQVKALLAAGANPNAAKGGEPALWQAAGKGHAAIIAALLAAGATVDIPGMYESTPLHQAAEGGHARSVRQLLRAGANPEATTDCGQDGYDGWTPLLAAAENGSADVVRLLLKAGARVNARTKNGYTPLLAAAHSGAPAVVQQLQQAGAEAGGVAPHFLEKLTCQPRRQTAAFRDAVADLTAVCGVKPLRIKEFQDGVAFDLARSPRTKDWTTPPAAELSKRIARAARLNAAAARRLANALRVEEPVAAVTHAIVEEHGAAFRDRGCSLVYMSMLPGDKLVLMPTTDPLAVVVALGPAPDGIAAMVAALAKLARTYPFQLHGASYDMLMLEFSGPVADADRLTKRLRAFGSDECGVLFGGSHIMTDRAKDLAALLKLPRPIVRLWWD